MRREGRPERHLLRNDDSPLVLRYAQRRLPHTSRAEPNNKGITMTGWFDAAAKRSARSAVASESSAESDGAANMSRRKVLVGGAAVAGLAWTAPVLMATTAYADGISTCPTDRICPPGTGQLCCPGVIGTGSDQYTCSSVNGTYTCIPAGDLGGNCTNSGQGTSGCNQPNTTNPIHCNGVRAKNICGGVGAICDPSASPACAAGLTCQNSTDDPLHYFCRA